MRHAETGFSIVDFLIIMALMLIVIGLFGPRLHQSFTKAKNGPPRTAAVHPAP